MNFALNDFKKSVNNLEQVLKMKKDDVVRDSAIKRFELCFDLAWKSIKNHAKQHGIECYSPRQCFKAAFQLSLIDYDEKWIDIIKDRNLTAHLYEEENADKVYSRLPKYLEMFKALLTKF